jgi:sulfatase modifying factor 1
LPEVSAEVRVKLAEIVTKHGRQVCEDLRQCQQLLHASCGEPQRRTVRLVLRLLEEHVPAELLRLHGQLPMTVIIARLVDKVERNLLLSGPAARWGVETWAVALGMTTVSAYPPKPESTGANAKNYEGAQAGQIRDDNGPEIRFSWIPSGSFKMGSPSSEADRKNDENQVEVKLTKGFWLGQYVVTEVQWDAVMQATKPTGSSASDSPATNVSWTDAKQFCTKLTAQERHANRLSLMWKYTLPSEAQWEYACRAGTTSAFSFGNDFSELIEYAWFDKNGRNAGRANPHPVGLRKPNPWGLYDMHGNVWEWCRDWYSSVLPGGTNPEVTSTGAHEVDLKGAYRVYRGGSWKYQASCCRSAHRNWYLPDYRSDNNGFRVALVPAR